MWNVEQSVEGDIDSLRHYRRPPYRSVNRSGHISTDVGPPATGQTFFFLRSAKESFDDFCGTLPDRRAGASPRFVEVVTPTLIGSDHL